MLGDRIKELRENAGMTQKQLSERLRETASAVGNYEQNTREPKYETLLEICEIFGVKADYLLTGDKGGNLISMSELELKKKMLKEMTDSGVYFKEGDKMRLVNSDDIDALFNSIKNSD